MLAERSEEMCEYLNDVFHEVNFGIVVESEDYEIIYMNDWLKERFGDKVGEKCFDVFPMELPGVPCSNCPVKSLLEEGGKNKRYRQTGVDGHYYELSAYPIPKKHNGRRLIVEVVREVTDIVRTEEKADLMILAMNTTRQPKIITDPKFKVIFANQAAVALLRAYNRKELIGEDARDIFEIRGYGLDDFFSELSYWSHFVRVKGSTISLTIDKLSNGSTRGFAFSPSPEDMNVALTKLKQILATR